MPKLTDNATGDGHDRTHPGRASVSLNPLSVLRAAVKVVPATKYALGVAGVAAAASIAIAFFKAPLIGLVATIAMLVLMVVLYVFSRIALQSTQPHSHAGDVLLWTCVLLFVGWSAGLTSCVFFNYPRSIAQIVSVFRQDEPPDRTINAYSASRSSTADLPKADDLVVGWSGEQLLSQPGGIAATMHGSASIEKDGGRKVFEFDGGGYLRAPAQALPTGDKSRTVEFWFKPSAYPHVPNEQVVLFCYGNFAVQSEEYCVLYSNARGIFFTNWGESLNRTGLLEINKWHHVAVTNQLMHVTLYIDDASPLALDFDRIQTAASDYLYIGGAPSDFATLAAQGNHDVISNFLGRIRDVHIYAMELMPENIAAIFHNRPVD